MGIGIAIAVGFRKLQKPAPMPTLTAADLDYATLDRLPVTCKKDLIMQIVAAEDSPKQ
jgi:hypothetical protein